MDWWFSGEEDGGNKAIKLINIIGELSKKIFRQSWSFEPISMTPTPPEVETTKIKQEIELIPIFLKVLTRPDQTKFVYAQPDDYSINEILSP